MARKIHKAHVTELLLQAQQIEGGAIAVDSAAMGAAINKDLRQQWQGYLEEIRNHVQIPPGCLDRSAGFPDHQPRA